MATITLTIVTGSTTTSVAKTFSSSDASRIMTAYQNMVASSGTQADLTRTAGNLVLDWMTRITRQSETVIPPAITFTSS